MDRQARKLTSRGAVVADEAAGSDAASELGSNSESDTEEKVNYKSVLQK